MTGHYRFLDEIAIADVAFEVEAKTLPDLFTVAAEALLAAQISDPAVLQDTEMLPFRAEDAALDMLFHRFLSELVYLRDVRGLLLRASDARVERHRGAWRVALTLRGEPCDPERHQPRAAIKAVTFYDFVVEQTPEGWRARVVVDV